MCRVCKITILDKLANSFFKLTIFFCKFVTRRFLKISRYDSIEKERKKIENWDDRDLSIDRTEPYSYRLSFFGFVIFHTIIPSVNTVGWNEIFKLIRLNFWSWNLIVIRENKKKGEGEIDRKEMQKIIRISRVFHSCFIFFFFSFNC